MLRYLKLFETYFLHQYTDPPIVLDVNTRTRAHYTCLPFPIAQCHGLRASISYHITLHHVHDTGHANHFVLNVLRCNTSLIVVVFLVLCLRQVGSGLRVSGTYSVVWLNASGT